MDDKVKAIEKLWSEDGVTGCWVWILEGPAVEGSTGYTFLVHYVDEPEPELHAIVPMGCGWRDLLLHVESMLEDMMDYEAGEAFTLSLKCYSAQDLAEIDCDV